MKESYKVLVALTLAVVVVLMALPADSVFAQGEKPPQLDAELPRGPQGIEALFEEVIERFEKAGEAMAKSVEVVEKLEDRIAKRFEAGRDAAGLEDILAAFQENMADVEEVYNEVGELIDEHAGFDVHGKVVDKSLAIYNLRQIAEGLLDMHQLGEDARFELKWDLMEYRHDLRHAD